MYSLQYDVQFILLTLYSYYSVQRKVYPVPCGIFYTVQYTYIETIYYFSVLKKQILVPSLIFLRLTERMLQLTLKKDTETTTNIIPPLGRSQAEEVEEAERWKERSLFSRPS